MDPATIAVLAGLGAILGSLISALGSFFTKAKKANESEITISTGDSTSIHVSAMHTSEDQIERIMSALSEIGPATSKTENTRIIQGSSAIEIEIPSDSRRKLGTEARHKSSDGVPEEDERD